MVIEGVAKSSRISPINSEGGVLGCSDASELKCV
jgi:hypothetical protein